MAAVVRQFPFAGACTVTVTIGAERAMVPNYDTTMLHAACNGTEEANMFHADFEEEDGDYVVDDAQMEYDERAWHHEEDGMSEAEQMQDDPECEDGDLMDLAALHQSVQSHCEVALEFIKCGSPLGWTRCQLELAQRRANDTCAAAERIISQRPHGHDDATHEEWRFISTMQIVAERAKQARVHIGKIEHMEYECASEEDGLYFTKHMAMIVDHLNAIHADVVSCGGEDAFPVYAPSDPSVDDEAMGVTERLMPLAIDLGCCH